MSGTLKLNDTLFATENSGDISVSANSVSAHSTETNFIQNSNVITQSLTIANNKNATISGPVSVHGLTINGSLNVMGNLTIPTTQNLTITGRLRII